jgi:heme exporter protein D
MNWGGWSNFWAMGGYGLYVWGSYAVTLFAIVIEVVLLSQRRTRILRELGMHETSRKNMDQTTL